MSDDRTLKASDLFVRCLEHEGVDTIFGVPGEETLDLLESLRASSIRFIVTRTEQAAGFMAATVGRLTGKPGVCLSTLGPGVTNFVTSAAYAYLGGMPVVIISGQKPIKQRSQGHFQIVNAIEVLKPVTKFSASIVDGARIPPLVREAFRIASQERPGPVHLELPKDIAAEVTSGAPLPVRHVRRPIAEHKAIEKAVHAIQQAHSPLLLIGSGANRKLTSKMLSEFVDATGVPFICTQMGKGVLDERRREYLGTAAVSEFDFMHAIVKKSDLILAVGYDINEKPPFTMNDVSVVHINFTPASVEHVYAPELEVIGDIANAIWQINTQLTRQSHWDFSAHYQIAVHAREYAMARESSDSFPVLPQRIVADVQSTLPHDTLVSFDNGMYKLWFCRNYSVSVPNSFLVDNALATMGAGLPSGIAAKLLYPDRPVVVITGDGGFMMNSQELETAVRLKLDLVILIINDNGFGMIKWEQDLKKFDRHGLDFGNPDFVKYAESYGAHGHRVTAAEQLKSLLEQCLAQKGVHLIDVPVDYSENTRVFFNELKEVTRDI